MRVLRDLVLCVSCFVAVAACSKKASKTITDAGVDPSPASSFSTSPTDTKTGIPECDAFLVKILSCIESKNVTEAQRGHFRRMFESARVTHRRAFQGTAADRAHSAQSCQAGLDGAKTTFESCP